jgi:hypothetical protein
MINPAVTLKRLAVQLDLEDQLRRRLMDNDPWQAEVDRRRSGLDHPMDSEPVRQAP